MEDPVNPLLSSLFNAAGILVGARAEAILDFLDALLGEEGSRRRLGWRKCEQRGLWEVTSWEEGLHVALHSSQGGTPSCPSGQALRGWFLIYDLLQAEREAGVAAEACLEQLSSSTPRGSLEPFDDACSGCDQPLRPCPTMYLSFLPTTLFLYPQSCLRSSILWLRPWRRGLFLC